MSTSTRTESIGREPIACSHCGLEVQDGTATSEALRFCCAACATAYAIIHHAGLDGYYGFTERREGAVRSSGRAFEEFDHDAFRALYVTMRPDGLAETALYLDGVHCASCVWLVEKMPLAIPGVAHAELDIGRAQATIVWDVRATPLSEVARFLDQLGYTPHPFRGGRADDLRKAEDRAALARIGVAGAIAGNVMMIALAIYAGWFGGIEPAFERYFRWWSLLLTTPAVIWPGRVFFKSAWGALKQRSLHMDVPIALAIGAGYLRGAVNTVRDSGPIYFDGVATLIFLLLVGRFLQQRAQRAAADSAELLLSLAPATARVVEGEKVTEVPTSGVLPGALLEVRAGDTLAADGVVERGESAFDLSLLTGESRPVTVREGDEVFGGTVNLAAPLYVRVRSTGESSRIGRLLADVELSAKRRAPIVRTADRMAAAFIAVVLGLAALTFVLWLQRDPSRALDNAIAMLVVTCPCALALATPLAVSVSIGRAARRGILVRGGDALETLSSPATLVLDKTGTITEGRLALVHWDGSDEAKPLVAALEQFSRHPVADAFGRAWTHPTVATVDDVREEIGNGVRGTVNGHRVVVGRPDYVAALCGGVVPTWQVRERSLSPVLVSVDGVIVGRALFGDPLRPESANAIRDLRARGWDVRILSGDDADVVRATGRAVGLPDASCRGGASPEQKREVIESLRAAGPVVMVGDGVNDASAIAAATVGIGVHGGAEACLAAADVFLARAGLAPLVELEQGARRTMRLIRWGIGTSLTYNLIGAGLALTGVMDPLIAAVVMPISSLTVVLVAWRGRTFSGARS